MKLFRVAVLASAVVLPATLSAHAATIAGDAVIARLGATDVKADEIRSYLAGLDPRSRAAMEQNPALLTQAVHAYLADRLVLKQALDSKWDQQANVAATLAKVRDEAIVRLYLASVSVPPADFPADAQVQAAYDANKTAFVMPRQFHLAQIFVAAATGADKATEQKARQKLGDIAAKLKQRNADFAAVAAASSEEAQSAAHGGDIGWAGEPQLVPEIRSAALGLRKDEVSEPLRLQDGWHIVKLLDTKDAYTRPLGEVRAQIVQQLREQRAQALAKGYIGQLLQKAPPVVDELALSNLLSAPSQQTAGK